MGWLTQERATGLGIVLKGLIQLVGGGKRFQRINQYLDQYPELAADWKTYKDKLNAYEDMYTAAGDETAVIPKPDFTSGELLAAAKVTELLSKTSKELKKLVRRGAV